MRIIKANLALVLTFSVIGLAGCHNREEPVPAGAGNTNSKHAGEQRGGLPADAKPMGQAAPGYFIAGPEGDVTLQFTAPQDDQVIEGNSIAPTFNVTGYPIYKDEARDKGQHIHVILDNELYEADYHPDQPFKPESGLFDNLKPGTHILRAYPSREWHESIKETDGSAFDMVVFHVKSKSQGVEIDKNAPLLTYSRPKGEYRWKDDPRGLLLDFYVANATISGNDFKVRYTIDGRNPKVLTRWEPVWLSWEEMLPGTHTVAIELIDQNNKPAPFIVNRVNYNRTERKIVVLGENEALPSSATSKTNANRR